MGFTRSTLTRFGRYRYLRMSFQINLAPKEFESNQRSKLANYEYDGSKKVSIQCEASENRLGDTLFKMSSLSPVEIAYFHWTQVCTNREKESRNSVCLARYVQVCTHMRKIAIFAILKSERLEKTSPPKLLRFLRF